MRLSQTRASVPSRPRSLCLRTICFRRNTMNQPVHLTSTVTKTEWISPHIFNYIDVADEESAEVVNRAVEMDGPNSLLRLGWKCDSLKTGDVIIVDGSPLANAETIKMTATGQRMLAGSSRGQ